MSNTIKTIKNVTKVKYVKKGYQAKPRVLPKKAGARLIIESGIRESGILDGLIVSLSAAHCDQERAIINNVSKEFRYFLVESNEDVYKDLTQKTPKIFKYAPSFWHGNMSEVVDMAKENTYSHCLFDYCLGIEKFEDEIIKAMANKIVVVGGMMAFTFCLRSGINNDKHEDFMHRMGQYDSSEFKVKTQKKALTKKELLIIGESKTEHAIRTFFNRNGGTNWNLNTIHTYRDGMPMALVILKRIK